MVDGDINEGIIIPGQENELAEEEKKRVAQLVKDFQEKRIEDGSNNGKVTFNPISLKQYQKTYGIVGNHSGVQICHWNKKSVKGHRGCYKVKFYGIDCHKCAQMSPALAWCTEACVFCWRPSDWMKKTTFGEQEVDDPELIINETVKARKKLISGLGGAAGVNKLKFKRAFEDFPSHWAISLSGEPTIYPRLGEMIKILTSRNDVRSVFVVTNGQEPEHLQRLADQNALPTQLYVSLTAANEEMFKKINRSIYSDGWQRLNRTLEIMAQFDCRRVIRFTLIKNVNDAESLLPAYAELMEKSKADFLEIKSYMALGFSRKRLGVDNMCGHEEVKKFSERLAMLLPNYRVIDDDWESRIVLLKRKDSKYMNIIKRPSEEARKLAVSNGQSAVGHERNGNVCSCNGANKCTQ